MIASRLARGEFVAQVAGALRGAGSAALEETGDLLQARHAHSHRAGSDKVSGLHSARAALAVCRGALRALLGAGKGAEGSGKGAGSELGMLLGVAPVA